MDTWRILHSIALIWLGAGVGSTYPLILKAWAAKDLQYQMYCLVEAANNETRILLPGAMASGISGFFWAVDAEWDFFRDGWLAALALSFVFVYFVCLPLLGFGLRRARLASLVAAKKGEVTEELRVIIEDRVPLVFGTAIMLSVPWMAWLAVFKPF